MFNWLRQSLLRQLFGGYLIFGSVILGVGVLINGIVRQQLMREFQASDQALAQAIAVQTDSRLQNARESLIALADLDANSFKRQAYPAMETAFKAFKAARPDIDRVYWLDQTGHMQVSIPNNIQTLGTDFSEERIFQRASAASTTLIDGGTVDLTTFNAVAIIATPIRDQKHTLIGVLATNVLLADFSQPLNVIVTEQSQQGQNLRISMLDDRGMLIASQERERLLQPLAAEIPGATLALNGQSVSQLGFDRNQQQWLYSSVPMPSIGWVVVVQRPATAVFRVVDRFSTWLLLVAVLFAGGGWVFWLFLVRRMIQPLHQLAINYRMVGSSANRAITKQLSQRRDEIGMLTQSLQRLDHDIAKRLRELQILLETSNAVVGTLDPQVVIHTITHEVQRLVDSQAVVVLVPDDHGALRVLASTGRNKAYDQTVIVHPDDPLSPSATALRQGQPVQMLADTDTYFPATIYAQGFRSLLAIPIISHHVGNVVVMVYRREARTFDASDLKLLLMFANYATLAWEHAILYERSDVRLQAVAQENQRLYLAAIREKQTLAAIIDSMSDGLILAGIDDRLLFANPRARSILAFGDQSIDHLDLSEVYHRLRQQAHDQTDYDRSFVQAQTQYPRLWLLEAEQQEHAFVLEIQHFNVGDQHQLIGYGLVLRDITREHEVEQFKTTLLAAVGHELRTPLAAIKGNASTLLQDDIDWPLTEQRHFLTTISNEADRLATMVTNLLDISRFEAGLLPLQRTWHQLDQLIDAGIKRLGRPIPRLQLRLPSPSPMIYVDAARFEVVIRNLIANGLAYGEGFILIHAYCMEHQLIIRIRDDGPGIAAQDLPYVFQRFYRAHHGIQRRSGGTGLGLAICKAFVEAHGGKIWGENDLNGTTMILLLPLAF